MFVRAVISLLVIFYLAHLGPTLTQRERNRGT